MKRFPISHELLRFGIVTVLGLMIDLSVAWSLARLAGLSLPLAALFGFLVAAGFNYVLHELWTFAARGEKVSARRGMVYLAGLSLPLATRLAVVSVLSSYVFPGSAAQLPVLVVAVGCSFVVNYVFSKYVVFRSRPQILSAQDGRSYPK